MKSVRGVDVSADTDEARDMDTDGVGNFLTFRHLAYFAAHPEWFEEILSLVGVMSNAGSTDKAVGMWREVFGSTLRIGHITEMRNIQQGLE